jgi:hypothetical protein
MPRREPGTGSQTASRSPARVAATWRLKPVSQCLPETSWCPHLPSPRSPRGSVDLHDPSGRRLCRFGDIPGQDLPWAAASSMPGNGGLGDAEQLRCRYLEGSSQRRRYSTRTTDWGSRPCHCSRNAPANPDGSLSGGGAADHGTPLQQELSLPIGQQSGGARRFGLGESQTARTLRGVYGVT